MITFTKNRFKKNSFTVKRLEIIFLSMILLAFQHTAANASEVRLGLSNHDTRGVEGGVTVQGQFVLGDLPEFPKKLNFRPFLTFSANSDGNLIQGGGGLQVNYLISKNWFLEFQGGIIGHNGQLLPPSAEFPFGRRLDPDRRLLFGCPALFHLSPSVGRRISKRAHLSLYYVHISHGRILCSTNINEGLDSFGGRVGFQF